MSQDRFEAMAMKLTVLCSRGQSWIRREDARRLLTREHAAVVRAVRKLKQTEADKGLSSRGHYHRACLDVLALLAARKGKKG